MILSGKKIYQELNTNLFITPFDITQLGPNSYNLRLHDQLMIYDAAVLDMKKNHATKMIEIPQEGLVLQPGTLYLGRTVEHTRTHNYVPMIEGRSSIGRLGLFIHITAGFGDVGFTGYWTLEIFCVHPIRIYPNVQICQIFYHTIAGEHEEYSSMKYQNNRGIQASMLYKEL